MSNHSNFVLRIYNHQNQPFQTTTLDDMSEGEARSRSIRAVEPLPSNFYGQLLEVGMGVELLLETYAGQDPPLS